jgi:hypothetical protein
MENTLVPIVLFIVMFGTLFGGLYFYFTTRNRERLALIEKNADASIFKSAPTGAFKKFSIKLGMLFVGAAIGTLAGNILTLTTGLDRPVAYLSMIFLFAGLCLIASYFVARKVKD